MYFPGKKNRLYVFRESQARLFYQITARRTARSLSRCSGGQLPARSRGAGGAVRCAVWRSGAARLQPRRGGPRPPAPSPAPRLCQPRREGTAPAGPPRPAAGRLARGSSLRSFPLARQDRGAPTPTARPPAVPSPVAKAPREAPPGRGSAGSSPQSLPEESGDLRGEQAYLSDWHFFLS